MIAVINYGMGNTGSIINMLHRIGTEAVEARTPDDLQRAEKIILPGVGTFDNGMKNLKSSGMDEVIKKAVWKRGIPLLGICLGMQILGTSSEEGKEAGLNLIDFTNIRFQFSEESQLKIPHMGWDCVDIRQKSDKLIQEVEENSRYYFVHSYHALCKTPENILMTCEYGYEFVAAVKAGNIYGTQFHPEKSHRFGMKLLENFVRSV